MSNISLFQNDKWSVRGGVDDAGEPWFVAKDVAVALGYTNHNDAISRHCRGVAKHYPIVDALGRTQEVRIIGEPDVYRLIFGSKLETAQQFENWVLSDVLPTIRKTGGYGTARIDVRDPSQLSQIAIQLIEVNKELENRAAKAEAAVEAAKPKTVFYDQFANADGLYGLQNAARVLGENPNKFIGMLKQSYLFYQGGALVPKVQYRQMGIFEVKATIVDDKARHQTYVTPKGVQYFAKKLGGGQLPLTGAA